MAQTPLPDPLKIGGKALAAMAGILGGVVGVFLLLRGGWSNGGVRPDREFEERLWTLSFAQLRQHGYAFDPEAAQRYRQLIAESVQTLGPPSRKLSPQTVQEVERAFRTFTSETMDLAASRGTQVVNWSLIEEIKKRLCPSLRSAKTRTHRNDRYLRRHCQRRSGHEGV